MIERNTFLNEQLQKEFSENGYVVIDAITAAEIKIIEAGYNAIIDPNVADFESTIMSKSVLHKKQVNEIVFSFINPLLEKHLNNHRPLVGAFLRKSTQPESIVNCHQDWTMTDETKYIAVNIWIPLVDVDEENGAIFILKCGQTLPLCIRGTFLPSAFDDNLFNDYKKLTKVKMKAGQALIYDLRCIHASPANKSKHPRLSIGCAAVPIEAQAFHYYYERQTKTLKCFEVDNSFFENYSISNNIIPEGTKLLSQITDYIPTQFIKEDQERLLNLQNKKRNVFIDPKHQEQYDTNGYVVIDFLTTMEVDELLNEIEKKTQWVKEGFVSSVYAPDISFRMWANDLLEPFANRLLSKYMIEYIVSIGTLMLKGSGKSSAMYPHQDWTVVDETQYASFNIWIPLVDVDFKNGAMSIMRGSHKLPFTIRGSNIPQAFDNAECFTPDKLTYMPMKAGQALIYDHRCVHVSPPNNSGKLRPACAIGVVPKDTIAFHCFYDNLQNKLYRYRADKHFFYKHVATQNEKPTDSILLEEEEVKSFYKFPEDALQEVFKLQTPRKKSIWEKLFSKS